MLQFSRGAVLKVCGLIACMMFATMAPGELFAQGRGIRPKRPGAGGAGTVNLPHGVNDNAGNNWLVYQGGWLQQRGNMPIYSQGAMLTINGNGVGSNNNSARLDEKTSEIVFDNLTSIPGVNITRRILFNANDGYVRYIDILKNTQPQEQSVQFQIQTNLNYGVTAAQNIEETGGKKRAIGWAAATQAGRSAVELYGGRNTKLAPNISWQQNNNFCQTQFQLTLPPNKDVAVMHVHATAATNEAGIEMMQQLRENKLLAGVPNELRKAIVNFNSVSGYIGDRELLRGDALDVVELRGGDQLRGTVKDSPLKLATFYGDIELAAESVIGLINVGQFRPRQLVVTLDGEIFGGQLAKETIELELSSGQVTQVPLSQITRIGWRKRAGEPEDGPLEVAAKPFVLLRSGDRVAVVAPNAPVEVNTRYGLLKLQPQSIAAIAFQSEETGVHQVFLTDGSRFAGLVASPQFDFKLAGGAGGQAVSFPGSSMARLQLSTSTEEPADDPDAPALKLMNDDLLVGALLGQLKLSTAFDTLSLNAPEIKSLSRSKDAGLDVQIELWDQTRMSGQLEEQELTVALSSGFNIKVPVHLVEEYIQPLPQPSAAITDKIKLIVDQLAAEDWKQRERAEGQLIAMGPAVIKVIKEMRAGVGPEAQQRIDSVIKQLEKARTKPVAPTVVPADE